MSSLWNELLPTSLEVCGVKCDIRSDYRVVLDILTALKDPDLDDQDKSVVLLDSFYPGFGEMPQEHYDEAIKQCLWFINGGEDCQGQKTLPLVDWEQDFKLIVAPINRVTGREIRSVEYMHWWTFISAYMEIGDCLFAQVIRIREKKKNGKPLDKSDREFYRKNQNLVDIKIAYTKAEQDALKQWGW